MTKERVLQIMDDVALIAMETSSDEDRADIQDALNYIEINLN